jgi:hypothetical protein
MGLLNLGAGDTVRNAGSGKWLKLQRRLDRFAPDVEVWLTADGEAHQLHLGSLEQATPLEQLACCTEPLRRGNE